MIKTDVKLIETSTEHYPLIETEAETNADFLPATLKLFLEGILVADVNLTSTGQAIMQSAHPGAILAPLQVGLAALLHHNVGG